MEGLIYMKLLSQRRWSGSKSEVARRRRRRQDCRAPGIRSRPDTHGQAESKMDSVHGRGRSRDRGQCQPGSIHWFKDDRQGLSLAYTLSRWYPREVSDGNVCEESRASDRVGRKGHATQEQTRESDGEETQSLCKR